MLIHCNFGLYVIRSGKLSAQHAVHGGTEDSLDPSHSLALLAAGHDGRAATCRLVQEEL